MVVRRERRKEKEEVGCEVSDGPGCSPVFSIVVFACYVLGVGGW